MGLSEAVQQGRREGLIALRDVLAGQIEACTSTRDVAALSRQLTDVLRQLDESKGTIGTPLDELLARRARRVATVRGEVRNG